MTAAKAGAYVLVSTAFYRVEGDGDDATRRRYKRGDTVDLSAAEAARLAVPTPLAPAAFVKAGEVEVVPGGVLVTSPPVVVNRDSQANQLVAEANTGVTAPAGGGLLTEQQAAEAAALGGFPSVTGAGAAAVIPTADELGDTAAVAGGDGKPARSATVDVWRDYAVKVGAVAAGEAGDLNKAALQEAVSRKEQRGT